MPLIFSKPYRFLLDRLRLLARRKRTVRDTPNPNAYWVVKDRLLAGEYPGGNTGGEVRHKIKAFLEAGITTFIDLTEPGEMFPYASLFKGREVEHRRFPIPDDQVPADPRHMADILDAVDAAMAAGRKVYVHCQGGAGRTGTVVACWLQRHGRTPREALRELHTLWRTTDRSRKLRRSPSRPVQVAWVKEWAKRSATVEAKALPPGVALRRS